MKLHIKKIYHNVHSADLLQVHMFIATLKNIMILNYFLVLVCKLVRSRYNLYSSLLLYEANVISKLTCWLIGCQYELAVNPVFEAAPVLEAALWVQANCPSLLQVT